MLRRLLSLLVVSLPLVATGLVPAAPAHAEGTPEETGVYMQGSSWFVTYGEPDSVTVLVIAEHGVPDGTASVEIDGQPIGGGTLSPTSTEILVQGHVVVPLPMLEPGDHDITLAYAGNERFAPSTFTGTLRVSRAEPTLALTASPDHAWPGQPVTLTATLGFPSGMAIPTGTITFRDSHTDLGVVPVGTDGTATLTTSALPVGEGQLSAIYTSDDRYGWASATIEYDVRRVATTTELSVTPAPATYGDTVRLVAVVRPDVTALGAPTGWVTFRIDGRETTVPVTPVGDPGAGVSSAVLEKAGLGAGTHRIGAHYSGTASFTPSDADSQDLVVARRTTTLTATPVLLGLNPWILPKSVLRATLTGNGNPVAGYPVTFTTGKTVLCTATTNAQGVATCDATAQAQRLALVLNSGYVASYPGDANNTASSVRGNLVG